MIPDRYEDQPSPCSCPDEVVALLALAVRYAEAGLGSEYPDALLGARYVKDFMEQPHETWCAYLRVETGQ